MDKGIKNIREDKLNEWIKPRTVFAFLFYYTYLVMISCGNPVPPLLEKIVGGLFIFYYANKAIKKIRGVE